jgi:hypothetical protein
LTLRSDVVLRGGRSGSAVKHLTGPPHSVIKGVQGRIFITDEEGRVILDITKDRVQLVTPGVGFGDKRVPTSEELELVERMWGK